MCFLSSYLPTSIFLRMIVRHLQFSRFFEDSLVNFQYHRYCYHRYCYCSCYRYKAFEYKCYYISHNLFELLAIFAISWAHCCTSQQIHSDQTMEIFSAFLWNSMPDNMKNAISIESFHKKLENYNITNIPCSICESHFEGAGYSKYTKQ